MPESRHTVPPSPVTPWATTPGGAGWLPHGYHVDVHSHTHGQLVYAAAGALATTTGRGTWVAPANRVTWTPPGFEHSHRFYGHTDVRVVPVPPELCGDLVPHPSVFAVSPLLREALLALIDRHEARPDRQDAESGRQGARPSRQDARPEDGRPGTKPDRYDDGPGRPHARPDRTEGRPGAYGRLLSVVIDELVITPEQSLHLPEPRDDRLRTVTGLLHADPAQGTTLTELGRTAGASERTLSRLFHAELGMSFHRWRTVLRIHHALVHLTDGRSVTGTAMACGWSNPSSFIDAFTEVVGQTPGRYQAGLTGERARPKS